MSRLLGIDYGSVRVGIAISDPLKIIAKPYKTLTYKNCDDMIIQIIEIINEKDVDSIIIGLPITLKNKISKQTEQVLSFIDKLRLKVKIPVISYDERFSSQIAQQALITQGVKTGHNKGAIDQTAAAIFLQNYIDENCDKK